MRQPGSALVVDDDPIVVESIKFLLERGGTKMLTAPDLATARRILETSRVDTLLLDMYLPDGLGIELLPRALAHDPPPAVLFMTARANVRAAVDAIQRGASDFLEKPLNLDDLARRLERAGRAGGARSRGFAANDDGGTAVVACSSALREVFALAQRVASTPSSSALLLGESGTGKEVVATRIHELSHRCAAPFVRVNLAAIPTSMVESELFGSVRGAFTDARNRLGLFGSAAGGTILLDELGEFRIDLQAKLLRVLEERRFFPVGSDRERRLDARVLAATNRDPKELIARGLLREDLYYRLATVTLRVPPLRERRPDIIPLAEHFCARFRAEFGRRDVRLGDSACAALLAYSWPGNVRELRNVIERGMMLAQADVIEQETLGLPDVEQEVGESAVRLADVEKRHIADVLRRVGGARTRAAELLGISRSTLWEKTKRYGLDVDRGSEGRG